MVSRVTRKNFAAAVQISTTHMSDILIGKKNVSVGVAKKLSSLTGQRWTDFLEMPPKHIEAFLIVSMYERQGQPCQG